MWVSINEYSQYKNISISTIRRRIRDQKVQYKKDKGKYLLYVNVKDYNRAQSKKNQKMDELQLKYQKVEHQYRKLQEENHDLKMLLLWYENQGDQLVQSGDRVSKSL